MAELNSEIGGFTPYTLRGYTITEPLKADNGGFSRWGSCIKDGRRFFIKQFINPVYPTADAGLSEDTIMRKKKRCAEWFSGRTAVYKKIIESQTGNLVTPVLFFRERSHYYLITDYVESSELTLRQIASSSIAQKLVMLKVLGLCFSKLAENGLVHADVKLDNLIVKKTTNDRLTVKVIDFDASYLESAAPKSDEIQGDPVYYAPETFLAMIGEPAKLTPKVDVFALGIVFHQLLCGRLPKLGGDDSYVYEAVLNDNTPELCERIPTALRELISKMLEKDPDRRISVNEVFEELKKMNGLPEMPPDDSTDEPEFPEEETDSWYSAEDFDV